jgi:hypothetical protein
VNPQSTGDFVSPITTTLYTRVSRKEKEKILEEIKNKVLKKE